MDYWIATLRTKGEQMSREQAWQLVCEFTQSDSLRKHMLAVEFAMRAYARRFGQDEELWASVGLLHDFDYERYPDLNVESHPVAGSKILRERGWSEEIIHSVLSHAGEYTGVQRETLMDKALYAVDELTGLITAVALVRPSKNIADVTVKSVKKKWKDKAFAAGVKREEIEEGAADLGVELWEHVGVVLAAMQEHATELGLDGSLASN
jgi:putative nucleotidyltransferase with HDIG domain